MILKIKLNHEDSKMPTKANESDAGLDVFAHSMRIVGEEISKGIYSQIDFIEYDCGITIEPSVEVTSWREFKEFFTFLAPRSSISKYNLVLCNGLGVLDSSYRGPILARFKYQPAASDFVFFGPERIGYSVNHKKIYQVGDRVAQLIVNLQPTVVINRKYGEFDVTERNNGGFGSSGQ